MVFLLVYRQYLTGRVSANIFITYRREKLVHTVSAFHVKTMSTRRSKMKNPWTEIKLEEYEKHMSLDSVYQLQAMNQMMKEQLYAHPVEAVMILGIAGGNGLEHIDKTVFKKVYGVDINESYLRECESRYPGLQDILETICADLTKEVFLPRADLLIANLFIEYVGCECFRNAVEQVHPQFVSCIIQVNTDTSFVSDSPYIHAFDRLGEVLHETEESALTNTMEKAGYQKEAVWERKLPNGKKLVRIEYTF